MELFSLQLFYERVVNMTVTKVKPGNRIMDIVKCLRLCNIGELYDIRENGTEKGIMRCIQETNYLVIFENPDKRYSWKRCVIDKRDVVANRVRVKAV